MTEFTPFCYRTLRRFPIDNGNSTMTLQARKMDKVTSFEQFIDIETDVLKDMLTKMHCDPHLINDALAALSRALLSSVPPVPVQPLVPYPIVEDAVDEKHATT